MTNLRIGCGSTSTGWFPGGSWFWAVWIFPGKRGCVGHSDADVLTHAVMDALAGASRLGDIGKLFPDTDPAYKGISSMKLLAEVGHLLEGEGVRSGEH